MRILITNDDGVASPALLDLVRFAKRLGDVTVIAPKVEQSGKSHAIDFSKPMEIKKVQLDEQTEAYSVDSTPADCVRFGVSGLGGSYDLLLSGINRGYNLGADIVYSGTVGAIFEGAREDIMGIALSAEFSVFETAHEYLDMIFDFMKKGHLENHHCLYNINIPPKVKGIRITRQGGIYYTDRFVNCGGDMYRVEGEIAANDATNLDIDIDAVNAGYISITPLAATRTDLSVFETLKALNG